MKSNQNDTFEELKYGPINSIVKEMKKLGCGKTDFHLVSLGWTNIAVDNILKKYNCTIPEFRKAYKAKLAREKKK